ncbi:uncharacterized protein VSU04_007777 isoform 4-T12 [Chlamydotis macqueenii]
MWNLKHGGGQPSGRSYRRGEKQKAASDLSDSASSAGSESCDCRRKGCMVIWDRATVVTRCRGTSRVLKGDGGEYFYYFKI